MSNVKVPIYKFKGRNSVLLAFLLTVYPFVLYLARWAGRLQLWSANTPGDGVEMASDHIDSLGLLDSVGVFPGVLSYYWWQGWVNYSCVTLIKTNHNVHLLKRNLRTRHPHSHTSHTFTRTSHHITRRTTHICLHRRSISYRNPLLQLRINNIDIHRTFSRVRECCRIAIFNKLLPFALPFILSSFHRYYSTPLLIPVSLYCSSSINHLPHPCGTSMFFNPPHPVPMPCSQWALILPLPGWLTPTPLSVRLSAPRAPVTHP